MDAVGFAPGGRASLALPRAILRVAAEKAGVRKNARFAHIMYFPDLG